MVVYDVMFISYVGCWWSTIHQDKSIQNRIPQLSCRQMEITPYVDIDTNDILIPSLHKQYLGGHLNKKDGLTRYGNSHVKDKTS